MPMIGSMNAGEIEAGGLVYSVTTERTGSGALMVEVSATDPATGEELLRIHGRGSDRALHLLPTVLSEGLREAGDVPGKGGRVLSRRSGTTTPSTGLRGLPRTIVS